MEIIWLKRAIFDLQHLQRYIAKENPSAARRVADSIIQSTSLLIEQPGIGRPGRVPNTRELIVVNTPYIIPYRVKKYRIELLRVFHSSMQWPKITGKTASESSPI